MNGGYDSIEEFFANVIENIYRSKKGLSPVSYSGDPFHPDTFFRAKFTVDVRSMLKLLQGQQPSLFRAIAAIRTRFNPIAQVEAEEMERMRQMDLRLPPSARTRPH